MMIHPRLRRWNASCLLLLVSALHLDAASNIPTEPVAIGHGPQFLFDSYLVDNHWALRTKSQEITRVFHQPVRHPSNPIIPEGNPSYLWVIRDGDTFRMYYQANVRSAGNEGGSYSAQICYAESTDGLKWDLPHLNLFPGVKAEPNNVIIGRPRFSTFAASGPVILDVPEKDKRGYRHLMLYRGKGRAEVGGIRIVGSLDGIHWDIENDLQIAHLHSDTHNSVSFDPELQEYVMFCRPKDRYRRWGEEMIDTGASRRVARLASRELWTDWMESAQPQSVLIPDEADLPFRYFYGMPTRHWAGVYWGFLEPFRLNDLVQTELVTSRDGMQFQRSPGRMPILDLSVALDAREVVRQGPWDSTMSFVSPSWVEVGDEWWIYYTGWDGPHGTNNRSGAVGLAKVRKEGFLSMRGPSGGGVVCTRRLIWPGGDLVMNADAREGKISVRVSDSARNPLTGLDHSDCLDFRGDSTEHRVQWKTESLSRLKGREIRLEFYLEQADLFSFRAAE